MRAIILAAGYGRRLGLSTPKCLLRIAGRSLLERHLRLLKAAGLDDGTVYFVTTLDANTRDGLLAETSGDLSRLIGRPTTPLREGLSAALA